MIRISFKWTNKKSYILALSTRAALKFNYDEINSRLPDERNAIIHSLSFYSTSLYMSLIS